jgi:cysteine desulfurase
MSLDVAGYACSSGSACKTGLPEPSDVLLAMGIEPQWALGSLRITLGSGTTPEEISGFLHVLPRAVDDLRRVAA